MARLRGEVRAIIKTVMTLSFFQKGGTSYNEILEMSHYERTILSEVQKEMMEQFAKIPQFLF